MTTDAPARLEARAIDDRRIDERDERALQQFLTVLSETGRARNADDLFLVVSESGSEYLVDAREQRCECPDHELRRVRCKHLRRVAFATGERPVPAGVEGLDDQLGQHLEATPCRPATDGGTEIIEAGDDAEILKESEDSDDGRPEDGTCDADDLDVACWPCYAAGFAFDNPADVETGGSA